MNINQRRCVQCLFMIICKMRPQKYIIFFIGFQVGGFSNGLRKSFFFSFFNEAIKKEEVWEENLN